MGGTTEKPRSSISARVLFMCVDSIRTKSVLNGRDIDGTNSIGDKSPLRLSTDSHVGAITYVYWSLCSSSQLRAISARASSRNWYQLCSKPSRRIAPECTKGSRSVNSIQQLTPDLLDVLCSRE